MVKSTVLALVASLGLVASAQAGASPQIPNPANPFPENPVATDGTSLLPRPVRADRGARIDGLLTGRSVFETIAPRD